MEPIKIYREGQFDRRYWYTLQAKRYMAEKAIQLAQRIDVIFEDHRLSVD